MWPHWWSGLGLHRDMSLQSWGHPGLLGGQDMEGLRLGAVSRPGLKREASRAPAGWQG